MPTHIIKFVGGLQMTECGDCDAGDVQRPQREEVFILQLQASVRDMGKTWDLELHEAQAVEAIVLAEHRGPCRVEELERAIEVLQAKIAWIKSEQAEHGRRQGGWSS